MSSFDPLVTSPYWVIGQLRVVPSLATVPQGELSEEQQFVGSLSEDAQKTQFPIE